MRVGRINAIKLVPYRDVKTLLRYFSIRGVAREAHQEDELAKINTLQAYDGKNLNQKISTRNALNEMVIDTVEKKTLSEIETNPNIDANNKSINLIKDMKEARKGSRTSALDMLAKSSVNSTMFNMKNEVVSTDKEETRQVELQPIKESIKNEDIKETKNQASTEEEEVREKESDEKQSPSVIEKYAQILKELEEKKEEQEKENTTIV